MEAGRRGSRPLARALADAPPLIAAAYVGSLWLPALELPGGRRYTGLALMLEGWRGLESGLVAWLANPLFVVSWLLGIVGARRAAGVAAGLGCVLALTSFAAVPLARGQGLALPELGWRAGFYVWLGAQFVQLGWAWLAVPRFTRDPAP